MMNRAVVMMNTLVFVMLLMTTVSCFLILYHMPDDLLHLVPFVIFVDTAET